MAIKVPSPRERVLIAVRAVLSPKTIDRAYSGRPTYDTTRERIVRAATELGFAPPPVPEKKAA